MDQVKKQKVTRTTHKLAIVVVVVVSCDYSRECKDERGEREDKCNTNWPGEGKRKETKDEMTGKVWEGRKQIKQLGKREGRASLLSPLFSTDWFLCTVGVERGEKRRKRREASARNKRDRQTDV